MKIQFHSLLNTHIFSIISFVIFCSTWAGIPPSAYVRYFLWLTVNGESDFENNMVACCKRDYSCYCFQLPSMLLLLLL